VQNEAARTVTHHAFDCVCDNRSAHSTASMLWCLMLSPYNHLHSLYVTPPHLIPSGAKCDVAGSCRQEASSAGAEIQHHPAEASFSSLQSSHWGNHARRMALRPHWKLTCRLHTVVVMYLFHPCQHFCQAVDARFGNNFRVEPLHWQSSGKLFLHTFSALTWWVQHSHI